MSLAAKTPENSKVEKLRVPESLFSPVNLLLSAVIRRDGKPLVFTVAGCAIAALIAIYQFTVLSSFLLAANAAPRYIDADVWVMARGVPAFDFPFPNSADYRASLLRHFPDALARRVVSGFGLWNAPSGNKGTLAVVGVDNLRLPRCSLPSSRCRDGFTTFPQGLPCASQTPNVLQLTSSSVDCSLLPALRATP